MSKKQELNINEIEQINGGDCTMAAHFYYNDLKNPNSTHYNKQLAEKNQSKFDAMVNDPNHTYDVTDVQNMLKGKY